LGRDAAAVGTTRSPVVPAVHGCSDPRAGPRPAMGTVATVVGGGGRGRLSPAMGALLPVDLPPGLAAHRGPFRGGGHGQTSAHPAFCPAEHPRLARGGRRRRGHLCSPASVPGGTPDLSPAR